MSTSPGFYNLIYGTTTLTGGTMIVLIIIWITKYQGGFGWSSSPSLEFNWHPFLMVLGLVFLYSQSILIYRTGRYHITKKTLKYLHATIHLVAFLCAVIGLRAVFDAHNRQSRANLYSLHSWIGLITVVIFAAQFLSGFVAFLYPGLSGSIRKILMPHHIFYGTIAFTMAITATVAGITEMTAWTTNYSSLPPVAYIINFIGLTAVLYGALTLYLLLKPEYKRVPLAED